MTDLTASADEDAQKMALLDAAADERGAARIVGIGERTAYPAIEAVCYDFPDHRVISIPIRGERYIHAVWFDSTTGRLCKKRDG